MLNKVATHFRTKNARQLLVLRVPGLDRIHQLAILVPDADVKSLVAPSAVELQLLHLPDLVLQFRALRQQLVTKRGR